MLREVRRIAGRIRALPPHARPRCEAGLSTEFGCTLEGANG
jgi:hydroxymethylglutaryl-CoA lyase